MMIVTMQEAQAKLPELLRQVSPGDTFLITEDGHVVATVRPSPPRLTEDRKLGTMAGTVLYMAPDFDAPLDDFKEYM